MPAVDARRPAETGRRPSRQGCPLIVCLFLAIAAAGCGLSGSAPRPRPRPAPHPVSRPLAPPPRPRRPPRYLVVLPAAHRQGLTAWMPAVEVRGQTAAWVARVPARGEPGLTVTLFRYDQGLVRLVLHAGNEDPGGGGWHYGDLIGAGERPRVVAAFNSAFRPSYGAGGFFADGRVGAPLRRGAASVVIYRDGGTDIGSWRAGVPDPARPVASVRQNLRLLIAGGRIASTVDGCIRACWGDPLHEQPDVARSALGITADGQLVWAAGETLSVRALADALANAGAIRALELDINPAWVAGYSYAHLPDGSVSAIPQVPGQTGIPGQFLDHYYRDFFTILARGAP